MMKAWQIWSNGSRSYTLDVLRPTIGKTNQFGVPTGSQEKVTPSTYDCLREVRPQMTVPVLSGVAPGRPEPPVLGEHGTQFIVTPYSPYGGHGAAQTRMDVRYRKIVAGVPDQPWFVRDDVSLAPEGRYVITITGTGGLDAHSDYGVANRYHNVHGPGAWSRNWSFTNPNSPVNYSAPWVVAIQKTATELPAAAPAFDSPPVIESYTAEGALARVVLNGMSGLPLPNVSYQWQRDGVAIAGAEEATYSIQSADVGTVLSAVVTVENTEGTVPVTITGETAGAGAGSPQPERRRPVWSRRQRSVDLCH